MEWQVSLWGMCYRALLFEAMLLGVTLWGNIATGKACFQSQYKNNVVMLAKWDWVYSGKSEPWGWWYTCTQTPGWIQNLDVQWSENLVFWCHLEVEGFEVHFMYIQVNNEYMDDLAD